MTWRSTLIALLVLAIIAGTQAMASWGNASFTMIDSYCYLVSKNNSHISISSEDKTFKECDLELNVSHVGRIQTAPIKRKILLLYRQNSTSIELLQLDPFLCLYNPLARLDTSIESSVEPQLILLNNTVDVFLRGHENCLPCRFDVNGNRLGISGQLADSELSLFKSFIVKEFLHTGQVRNYALAGNFASGTSVLKIYDENFGIIKEVHFNHRIEALAANSGSNDSWIGIIFAGLGNPYGRVLALYTRTLELLFETRVRQTLKYKVYDTQLSINSTGHSFVNYMQTAPTATNKYSNYEIYRPNGVLGVDGGMFNFPKNINYDWQLLLYNNKFGPTIHKYYSSSTESGLLWL